jgi:hypothetical protein
VKTLPQRPDIEQLKRQAKELVAAFLAGDAEAVVEVNAHYRDADPLKFALHDAQLVVARLYGFESWPKLRARVDGVTVGRLCDAVERGDGATVRDMLRRRPEIVNMERPGYGEQRAVHVAVLRRDVAMVRLLMEHGADPHLGIWPNRDATSALTIATERRYDEIVAILSQRAELGTENPRMLIPSDGPLTIAVKQDRPDALRELLEQGSDPDVCVCHVGQAGDGRVAALAGSGPERASDGLRIADLCSV